MVESYSRDILKVVVAQICQTIGWHAIHSTAIELLTDVLHNYIHELGHTAHRYGEQFGHTIPTLDDVGLAFRDMGISVPELEEYVEYVASVPCAIEVPKYPIEKESHLNLLKPGSREVVTRPVHIHEHLPAMHPELEEEEYSVKQSQLSVDTSLGNETGSPPQSSPKTNIFKRPGDPVSLENPSLKRARLMLEEEGRPLREISSVMMTTSGFLSPAREGKLPEPRTPIQPSDSRSNSPQPLSYPAVPPEVKGEKKIKKNPPKPGVDGIKKLLDKENNKAKESGNGDTQIADDDDPNVKKLVSMKELSKLKALKSGALKMMAQNSSNTQSGINKTKPMKSKLIPPTFVPNMNIAQQKTAKKIEEKPPKPDRTNMSMPPSLFKMSTFPEKVTEKTKVSDPNVVDGKLTSEPDKQKLNIFKKISKVKEEKTEHIDVVGNSRESSPTLVASDQENNRQREVRWAQISETIEAVIQRSREIPVEPFHKQQTDNLDASDTELFPYDDEISPPATPTIPPRTPDITLLTRKADKTEVKKRKKDKNKDKKESKDRSLKSPSPPKRFKPENNESDYLLPEKPKTPEVETARDDIISQTQQPPVFPFFTHFSPAPGLIPPPIGHTLFTRFNLPLVKPGGGLIPPHPAMPNLPIPPPLFMQPRIEDREPPRIKIPTPPPVTHPPSLSPVLPPTPPSTSSVKPEVSEKVAHTPAVTKEKEKSIEKEKKKEHKKDKKEKIKKKKDKKDKSKNKDKGEKKKDKSEKKEKDKEKSKEKREKKEKKREKELQREEKEKAESSVPKITFKLGPVSPQQPPTPEPPPTHRKIVIKPVFKKSEEPVKPVEIVEAKKERERSPSPELARISALVTRPPKPKSLSKAQPLTPYAHSVQPLAEPTPQPPPPVLPQPSISTQGKKSTNTTISSSPKIKQKDVPKKARDNEVVKDTVAFYFDNEGNQVWICPACGGQDDGSPMIGCDGCDAWYHWVCVGIQVPPDSNDWFCRVCIGKKDELVGEKKKKIRKKKTLA